jgi:hypothetical protein
LSASSFINRCALDTGKPVRRATPDGVCVIRVESKLSRMRVTRVMMLSPEREFAMATACQVAVLFVIQWNQVTGMKNARRPRHKHATPVSEIRLS